MKYEGNDFKNIQENDTCGDDDDLCYNKITGFRWLLGVLIICNNLFW